MKRESSNDKERFSCALLTLIGSSSILFVGAVIALLAGISLGAIERALTYIAIPWFASWKIFCEVSHRIKIEFK